MTTLAFVTQRSSPRHVKTVLVVDDDPDFRAALSCALSDEGYHPIEAFDGVEALKVAAGTPPTLMLVDMMMPRMGGLEFLQRVKRQPALQTIPIVIITAVNDPMLSVRLDLPVVFKGDLETIVQMVRCRINTDSRPL